MKILSALIISLASGLAHADTDLTNGEWSWICTETNGGPMALSFSNFGFGIANANVAGHQIVRNGKVVADHDGDSQVVGVEVGDLMSVRYMVNFHASLFNGKDHLWWSIALIANDENGKRRYSGAVLQNSFNKDTDAEVQDSQHFVNCQVTRP